MKIKPQKESTASDLTRLHTEDTIHVGKTKFTDLEHKLKGCFVSKEMEVLSLKHEIKFSGAIVRQKEKKEIYKNL